MACDETTGRLLAALAAAVPSDGRVLELGTGVGVGTAWIVSGLGDRTDVRVVSVEIDPDTAALARDNDWPSYVDLHLGDALELLGTLGTFDLVFADARGGKTYGLDRTIAALAPQGVLLVDDMTPLDSWSEEGREQQERVRVTLTTHTELLACELRTGSGLLLCARR